MSNSPQKRLSNYSPEVLRGSQDIIRAFKTNISKSQAGKVERGKNRMLVENFLLENKRIIGNYKYNQIFGIVTENEDDITKTKLPRNSSYETLSTYKYGE
jgi:hypothetical protein